MAQQPDDARKPDPAAEAAGRILDEVRALAAELRPHHTPAGGVGLDGIVRGKSLELSGC